MNKISPKLKLDCKKCKLGESLENISFKNIKISEPKNSSSKIITLKGKNKKEKNKGLF